jgi:hypothetical protein
MSNQYWAVALIGFMQLDADRAGLNTRVICYGGVLLVWTLFFATMIDRFCH